MKSKKILSLLVLASTFFLFQNFRFYDNKGNLEGVQIDLNEMYIQNSSCSTDSKEKCMRNRKPASVWHAVKTQVLSEEGVELDDSNTLPVIGKNSRLNANVISFQTKLEAHMEKTRSEIRVRNADILFSDSDDDKTYYAKFEIYVPHRGDVNNIPRGKDVWNLIWQVAQIGASKKSGYSRNTSPPLGIQLFNRRLYVKSVSSKYHKMWYNDFLSWEKNSSFAHDTARRTKFESLKPAQHLKYIGYVNKNAWNKIFISFKLGEKGHYDIWLNSNPPVRSGELSIGYQTAEDPYSKNGDTYIDSDGEKRIKKRASARFGIYQGYSGSTVGRDSYNSKILFKSYSIGTNWDKVRQGTSR